MTEHLTQNQVQEYCRQQLSAAELLMVSDHLGECNVCCLMIETALGGDATFFALRSEVFSEAEILGAPDVGTHPTVELTADYVDGRLAGEDLQRVTDHLSRCEECALAIDDLRTFSNQIAPDLDREYHPASTATPGKGWWYRTVAPWASIVRRSPALALGSTLMLLLLALIGWLIWRVPGAGELKQEPSVSSTPPVEDAAAPVIAEINDGDGRLILDREGKLSGGDHLPLAYQSMIKQALADQRIEPSPLLRGLARASSPLMTTDKRGSKFSVIEPVGKVLLTDRPTFRWSPLEGTTGYVVEVYDGKFNLVTTSPQLTDHSWTASQSLARGDVYSWQVKAIKDGQEFKSPRPPAPQAKFRILDRESADELAKARRDYASSHLALGLLYARAGLLDEAQRELLALQKANPDSDIVRRLLENLLTMRR